MKLHILPLFAAGLLATAAAVSCSEDPYWTDVAASQLDKFSFFLPMGNFKFTDAAPLEEVKVKLVRATSADEAQLTLKLHSKQGTTSLPNPVVLFAKGSTTAECVVKVHHARLPKEKNAVDTLFINADQVSGGGYRQYLLTIEHKK